MLVCGALVGSVSASGASEGGGGTDSSFDDEAPGAGEDFGSSVLRPSIVPLASLSIASSGWSGSSSSGIGLEGSGPMGFTAGARLKYCLRRAVCQLLRLVEEMKKRERSESKCGDRGREDGGGELERISGKGELRRHSRDFAVVGEAVE